MLFAALSTHFGTRTGGPVRLLRDLALQRYEKAVTYLRDDFEDTYRFIISKIAAKAINNTLTNFKHFPSLSLQNNQRWPPLTTDFEMLAMLYFPAFFQKCLHHAIRNLTVGLS